MKGQLANAGVKKLLFIHIRPSKREMLWDAGSDSKTDASILQGTGKSSVSTVRDSSISNMC